MVTLRDHINSVCMARLGHLPNLENPTGYNDKIQWLKLHDQTHSHIRLCDKMGLRERVNNLLGPDHLTELLFVSEKAEAIRGWNPQCVGPFVVKTNHDSGSAKFVSRSREIDDRHISDLSKRLSRPYGVDKGEWGYQHITPRVVMIEKALSGPIVDYKFHCCNGVVKWLQVISDRQSGKPRETIATAEGTPLPLHMDHSMIHEMNYKPSKLLHRARVIAERLSFGFRYVRVDTYCPEGGPVIVGEMTFWPKAGCYKTEDEPAFGELLDFDMSYKRPQFYQ